MDYIDEEYIAPHWEDLLGPYNKKGLALKWDGDWEFSLPIPISKEKYDHLLRTKSTFPTRLGNYFEIILTHKLNAVAYTESSPVDFGLHSYFLPPTNKMSWFMGPHHDKVPFELKSCRKDRKVYFKPQNISVTSKFDGYLVGAKLEKLENITNLSDLSKMYRIMYKFVKTNNIL